MIKKEYAIYKGDTFIDLGTREYLANKLNVRKETITYLSTPSALKRRKKGEYSNSLIAIRIDDDELVDDYDNRRIS